MTKLKALKIKSKGGLTMTVKDIIALGKMGYTKDDIAELNATETKESNAEIESLKDEIAKLQEEIKMSNVRATATKETPQANAGVEDALKMLAGVTNG